MDNNNFDERYEEAIRAADLEDQVEPRAASAQYEPHTNLIVVSLRDGGNFSFSPLSIQELITAPLAQLSEVEVTPAGDGLSWPTLDVDLGLTALMEGIFGPPATGKTHGPEQRVNTPLFDYFCEKIEVAWTARRDATMVDKIAALHPEHSEALYSFFSDLIGAEFGTDWPRREIERSVGRTKTFLEETGYTLAAEAAREARRYGITTTRIPQGAAARVEEAKEPPDEPRSLVGMIQDHTHERPSVITANIGVNNRFLSLVQDNPECVPEGAIDEIASKTARVYPFVSRARAIHAIRQPSAIAASRDDAYPNKPTSYEELVERASMSPEEKDFWLSFARK